MIDTGRIVFIIVMGWSLIIYGGLTYLVVKKKEYGLLSGFGSRPEEEKEILIYNGYINALGKLLKYTFYLLVLSFLLGLSSVPFGFEVSIGIFSIVLMVGIVWVQRYEVPRKRKKMVWITGIISAATFMFICGLTVLGFMENEVIITEESFEVSGMYGVEWPMEEITSVELLDTMPEIIVKTNGFAAAGQLKGRFRLEDPYNGILLFVQKNEGPFLYVSSKDDHLILSRDESSRTKEIYESLMNTSG
ncbi:DUF3784 domain-containing protein [Halobacillus sp. H74]|uniref:DUF3784 domain-containing protein n=1 Tax=Halobacillus sp. H74 TaxID=3457436 RepID=UPI003FCD2E6A